ncbi:MAG: DUF87 domain-containing protein [Nanoarchaeota archaeon]|nr:DUF87 domain-containing protein [Nanoarchaeota archaeon]MBU4456377.1 DUF87 domain-containing protein [Nanoarchaeota archaeon]
MILGKITGKVSTNSFRFEVKGDAKKFGYVQVSHPHYGFVLGQILEIERTAEASIAICNVLGYRDSDNIFRGLRTPFEPGIEVLRADDDFVKKTLGLELAGNGAFMGVLDGRNNLKVHIDIDTLITKHIFITGKSGSGKSYAVAVILEALLDAKVPLVIIDPHGEYHSFNQPSEDVAKLQEFQLKPKAYLGQIEEFSPDIEANPRAKALKLNSQRLTPSEMIKLLPTKLSNSQLGVLYSALKNLGNESSFDDLIFELESSEESSAKWTLINMLEYVKRLNLFSDNGTLPSELVNLNKCSIINLRGIPPEVQEVIVYKLANDLFMERKRGNIPPFFLVVEEAQNFCPERGFGEAKSNAILRQIAAEGRKFGMGLAIISQRPSRIEKSIISQVSTQVILKVTNPNDIKAITNSVEGMTFELENELQNIPIGTALITGVIDLPLFVNIRPRCTKHGGEAVKIFSKLIADEKVNESNLMLLVQPKMTARDMELMSETSVKVITKLAPCVMLRCNQGSEDFNLLVDLNEAKIINNVETNEGVELSKIKLYDISEQQSKVFQTALKLGKFKPAELFSKSGVQFSDLYDLITVLVQKGYLEQEGDSYKVSGLLQQFSNLQTLAVYQKPEFIQSKNDGMLDKIVGVDSVKSLFVKFAQVKSLKECWLVKHIVQ